MEGEVRVPRDPRAGAPVERGGGRRIAVAARGGAPPARGSPPGTSAAVRPRWPFRLAFLFSLWACLWSLATPVGEAPDEDAHFHYAQWIARHGEPPPLDPRVAIVQRHQMPLYHGLLAAAMRATGADRMNVLFRLPAPEDAPRAPDQHFLHGADETSLGSADVRRFHALRLLSIAFGTIVVLATAIGGRALFPVARGATLVESPPFLASAFVATLPQFLHVSGALSNDPAAAGLAAAALALAARAAVALGWGAAEAETSRPLEGAAAAKRASLLAGLAAGAAVSAKLSAAPIGVMLPILLAAAVDGPRRARIVVALRCAAGFVAAASPYFLWNAVVRGDALAHLAFEREHFREKTEFFFSRSGWEYYVDLYAPLMFKSFFANPGWMLVDPGAETLVAYAGLAGVGIAGAVWGFVRDRSRGRAAIPALALLVLASVVPQAVYARAYGQNQGRHLYPALPAIALLVGYGWSVWIARLRSRAPKVARAAALSIVAGLAAISAECFATDLLPAFTPRARAGDPYHTITDLERTLPRDPTPISLVDAPADAAVLGGDERAPAIRWEPEPGASYAVHFATDDPSFSAPPYDLRAPIWRTLEYERRLLADSYEIPSRLLRGFPPGSRIHWRVVRLVTTDDSVAGSASLRTSETRHFVVRAASS